MHRMPEHTTVSSPRVLLRLGAVAALIGIGWAILPSTEAPVQAAPSVPIRHVVVIYQENHSFNEVLGYLCVKIHRCKGTLVGKRHDGATMRLRQAPDVVPGGRHTIKAQRKAMNGGKMNAFDTVHGCTRDRHYACYEQYRPSQIPNLATLARHYVIADHTFESNVVSSWGSHIELVAGQLDGFTGDNPIPSQGHPNGPGWGCDSFRDTPWRSPGGDIQMVPSCVPNKQGFGPYRPSPVKYVPTIMDRLHAAGRSWRIYRPPNDPEHRLPYGWAICPTFAECLYSDQKRNVHADTAVLRAATSGHLPSFSIVVPQGRNSQHNGWSMQRGDNWIGSVLRAIMHGPQWGSTAVFVTYDDCGCFYDEVPPPAGMGIRVPMVIVSPYARSSFTDTTVASSYDSVLAFTERVFGLQPLTTRDAGAYDFFGAFNFSKQHLETVRLRNHPLPRWERVWLRKHLPEPHET
jgi:phospholipase C